MLLQMVTHLLTHLVGICFTSQQFSFADKVPASLSSFSLFFFSGEQSAMRQCLRRGTAAQSPILSS